MKNGITLRSSCSQIMAIISFMSIGVVLVLMLTGHLKGQGTGFEALDELTRQATIKRQEEAKQQEQQLQQLAIITASREKSEENLKLEKEAHFKEMEKYFVPNTMEFRPLTDKNGMVMAVSETLCFPRTNWIVA